MEELKELDKVKPEKVTLFIQGKEREIKFNFSAWAKLEKEFGGLKNLSKLQEQVENEPFTVIPHLLYIGLKDKSAYMDESGKTFPEVTEENILDEYGLQDVQMISETFNKALYGSLPKEDESKKEVEAKME